MMIVKQIYLYYRGKLVHRFKKGYEPNLEECLDKIVDKGYYQCEVYSFRGNVNALCDNGVEVRDQDGAYFYPKYE